MILRELTTKDEVAFFDGLKEYEGEDLFWYTFVWKPGMSFAQMLDRLSKNHRGEDLAPNRVPDSMLYGFVDGKIVGRVSIRHKLNDVLLARGGHIGYSVAPKYRRKGYAREMVNQAVPHCRKLRINPVLVTCAEDNVASWKIVESIGGVLENKVWDEADQETIRRYWIDI